MEYVRPWNMGEKLLEFCMKLTLRNAAAYGWLVLVNRSEYENPSPAVLQPLKLFKLGIHASTPLVVIVQPVFHHFVDAEEAIPFLEPRRQPVIHLGLKPRPQQSATEGHGGATRKQP